MKCNRDCFNCIYDDCIDDSVERDETDRLFIQEYKEMPLSERRAFSDEYDKAAKRIYARERYKRKKEEIQKYQKDYYTENRDKIIKRNCESNKRWLDKPGNREKMRKYAREYYAKKNKQKIESEGERE